MTIQYPHFLFVKQITESVQDADGNWSEATQQWVPHSICREQTNGKGSMVRGVDGNSLVFSSLIHLPSKAARIKEGTEVLVSETDDLVGAVRIEGQALKYDVGLLHNRLWV